MENTGIKNVHLCILLLCVLFIFLQYTGCYKSNSRIKLETVWKWSPSSLMRCPGNDRRDSGKTRKVAVIIIDIPTNIRTRDLRNISIVQCETCILID